jgi:ubiquinone/menaquinone biosynthesis C-methylase UbiE
MERILEPEYMDTAEEASGYDAMDHRVPNDAFVTDFLALGGGDGLHLDIGTGPGDIPILLAQRAPRARIVALDAAHHMLALARRKIAAAGLEQRVRLHAGDAKRLPFADAAFDAVFSNTILHHIPDPAPFLGEAWRVLAPGGALMIRDLCRPASEARAHALVDLHAAAATPLQRKLLFDSLHAALTLEEARALVAKVGMRGATVRMTSDRHYTIERRCR